MQDIRTITPLEARRRLGVVFFPAFDWAISPTHPEREERLLYTQGEREYFREIEIPAHVLEKARGKIVGGRAYSVLTVRFEGEEDEPSARVCGFIRILAE